MKRGHRAVLAVAWIGCYLASCQLFTGLDDLTYEDANSSQIASSTGTGSPGPKCPPNNSGRGNGGRGNGAVLSCNGTDTYPVLELAAGREVLGLRLGDVNDDCHQDIVVVNQLDRALWVYLSNGTGKFQDPIKTFNVGRSGADPALGDLNGDGHVDVVLTLQDFDQLQVLLGNGDGTFTIANRITQPNFPQTAFLDDVNSDGRLDILLDTDVCVAIRFGNGDGTFAESVCTIEGKLSKIQPIDINNDGRAEVVAMEKLSNGFRILIFEIREDASLKQTVIIEPDSLKNVAEASIHTGDVNRDGIEDIVVSNRTAKGAKTSWIYLLGDQDGDFSECLATANQERGIVGAADVDGDGKTDLVTSVPGTFGTSNEYGTIFVHFLQ